jgi:hypothetical protein
MSWPLAAAANGPTRIGMALQLAALTETPPHQRARGDALRERDVGATGELFGASG